MVRRAAYLSLAIPGLGVTLSGCHQHSAMSGADSDAAGDMMHGGAGTAMPISPELIEAAKTAKLTTVDAALPAAPASGVLKLDWRSQETAIRITSKKVVAAWTFEKSMPSPTAHCRVGDTVDFTLTNDVLMPHSMDFHAARVDPQVAFRSVDQGQSVSFSFQPRYAGAFLYHCGTEPMLWHIGAGMFGALIVSPREPLPPAREFVLVQSEMYLGEPTDKVFPFDFGKMLNAVPEMVVFNGRPDQYVTHPLRAKLGERVRFWVVNAGPTHPCVFHVVGIVFDKVYLAAPPGNFIEGVQSFSVPAGGGMVFELECDVPGRFPFVNHALGYGQKGTMGYLIVEET